MLENENLKAKLSDLKAQVSRHTTELSLCEKQGEKKLQLQLTQKTEELKQIRADYAARLQNQL